MFRSVPTGRVRENSNKTAKKLKKIKKIPLWHHLLPKQVGKGCEEEKIKIIVLFRSNPTRNRKLQKNSKKKNKKIKRYHYGFISGQNLLENAEKGRK